MPILEVENLSISFKQYTAGLNKKILKLFQVYMSRLKKVKSLLLWGRVVQEKVCSLMPFLAYFQVMQMSVEPLNMTEKYLPLHGKQHYVVRKLHLIPQSVNYLDPLMRVGKQVRTSVKKGDADCSTKRGF